MLRPLMGRCNSMPFNPREKFDRRRLLEIFSCRANSPLEVPKFAVTHLSIPETLKEVIR